MWSRENKLDLHNIGPFSGTTEIDKQTERERERKRDVVVRGVKQGKAVGNRNIVIKRVESKSFKYVYMYKCISISTRLCIWRL